MLVALCGREERRSPWRISSALYQRNWIQRITPYGVSFGAEASEPPSPCVRSPNQLQPVIF